MNGTAVKKAQKRTLVLIIAAGVAIAAFTVVLIGPVQFKISVVQNEIETMQAVKKEQETIYPVYVTLSDKDQQLSAMLNTFRPSADAPVLPETGIKPLPAAFKKIAETAGFTLDACVPDIRSIEKNDPDIDLGLTLNGQFTHFPVLLSLLESQDRIQGIKALSIKSGPRLTYNINLFISMKASKNGKLET